MNSGSNKASCLSRAATLLLLILSMVGINEGQQAITITSPNNGSRVEPGQTIIVQVSTAPGSNFQAVQVIGENIAITPQQNTSPYSFSLTVPADLIGPKKLTALGIISPENGVFSPSVIIDSETTANVIGLRVNLSQINFSHVGQQMPLNLIGTFDDGTSLDITRSSLLSYHSVASTIASVDANGIVTAAGPGETTINISYGNQMAQVQVTVPISIRGDLNGDGRVDKDDLNIILAALNTTAIGPDDARDLNHDGVISALDARILVTLCTLPGCATH